MSAPNACICMFLHIYLLCLSPFGWKKKAYSRCIQAEQTNISIFFNKWNMQNVCIMCDSSWKRYFIFFVAIILYVLPPLHSGSSLRFELIFLFVVASFGLFLIIIVYNTKRTNSCNEIRQWRAAIFGWVSASRMPFILCLRDFFFFHVDILALKPALTLPQNNLHVPFAGLWQYSSPSLIEDLSILYFA